MRALVLAVEMKDTVEIGSTAVTRSTHPVMKKMTSLYHRYIRKPPPLSKTLSGEELLVKLPKSGPKDVTREAELLGMVKVGSLPMSCVAGWKLSA